MPTQVQFRRGTTTQNESFTGAVGELSVDTTLDTVRVHDGSTAGGIRLAKYSEIQSGDITAVVAGTGLSGGATSGSATVNLSHLGLESLSDPNDDQIIFWDDSAGATAFLDLGTGLSISGTTISVGTLNQDTTGNAATATALETARTIGGTSFDGTASIAVALAATATTLATARTINGVSFDGSANVTTLTAGTGVSVSGTAVSIGQAVATSDDVTFADVAATGNVTITGNLDVNGTTTTLDSTNSTITDRLIELGNGTTGTPANDMGLVFERGSSDNAFIGWDESADKFLVGTGSFTGASTGDLTVTTGTLVANLEGNVTGNVTGNTSGSSGSTTGNAATATALATARTIGGTSFDGTADIAVALAATASALATARTLSFTGDVTGTGDFDGSGNLATALTIAANSVALGTDTTGNYMAQVSGGDGITISHTQSEGSTATITGTAIYDSSGTKLN